MASKRIEKELGTLLGVLSDNNTRGFHFQIEQMVDDEYGLCEIRAVWKAPLDEVLPEEYERHIVTSVIEPKD